MISRIFLGLVVLLAGASLGLGAGLYVGWVAWPVSYTDTSVDSFRSDYKSDYIVMTAGAYAWDGDLARARTRLQALNAPEGPLGAVEGEIKRLSSAPSDPSVEADMQRLNRLALDLRAAGEQVSTPTPTPTSDGEGVP